MPRQERREQVDPLDELERRGRRVEGEPQADAEGELDQRDDQRGDAGVGGARAVAAGREQHPQRRDDRQQDDDRQDGEGHWKIRGTNHVAAAATPTSIISA